MPCSVYCYYIIFLIKFPQSGNLAHSSSCFTVTYNNQNIFNIINQRMLANMKRFLPDGSFSLSGNIATDESVKV